MPARPATRRSSTAAARRISTASAYAAWLRQLREVCSARGIVLIFDEVFVGFRLAPGGAQEYFGVRADMVTYGKTVAGGLPVGVLCGRARFMRRFREDRPADICFARGTFNSHPYVMGAMHEFLQRLETRAVRALYRDLDEVWNAARAAAERAVGGGAAAGARRESVHDLDHLLPAAVALQLDVSILFARRGTRVELGGHGAPDLQPELHATRTSPRSPTEFVSAARGDAARRLVVGRAAAHQQVHQAPRAQGNDSGAMGFDARPWDRSARRAASKAAPCQ